MPQIEQFLTCLTRHPGSNFFDSSELTLHFQFLSSSFLKVRHVTGNCLYQVVNEDHLQNSSNFDLLLKMSVRKESHLPCVFSHAFPAPVG